MSSGFIDDDVHKHGAIINGVEVLGSSEDIPQIVESLAIDYVIISIAQASRDEFQNILSVCQSIPIKVRTIPSLYELIQEKVSVSRIRDIEIEDLFGRPPVQLDKESIESFLEQKTVMVTGAGGSIGSELVRQLVHCKPKRLVLVERCEFSLFKIEREIKTEYPDMEFHPVIGDVCDETRMKNVFGRYKPEVVFHAAAHKHVPMMELNASEAIKNNILGTNSIAHIAGLSSCEAFVLISTDKAVNPTSVMGATKRVSELSDSGSQHEVFDALSCGSFWKRNRFERFGDTDFPSADQEWRPTDRDTSRNGTLFYDDSRGIAARPAGRRVGQRRRDFCIGHGKTGQDSGSCERDDQAFGSETGSRYTD